MFLHIFSKKHFLLSNHRFNLYLYGEEPSKYSDSLKTELFTLPADIEESCLLYKIKLYNLNLLYSKVYTFLLAVERLILEEGSGAELAELFESLGEVSVARSSIT